MNAAASPKKKKKPPVGTAGRQKGNIQENLENKVFMGLIKRYTEKRDWSMLEDVFDVYGRLLLDREEKV